MYIGITGTDGAGKGEKRTLGASQDLAYYFLQKIVTRCTASVRCPRRDNANELQV